MWYARAREMLGMYARARALCVCHSPHCFAKRARPAGVPLHPVFAQFREADIEALMP